MGILKFLGAVIGLLIAAAIVVPLALLAGLFVWLKLTEDADEDLLELEQETGSDAAPDLRPGEHEASRRPATGRGLPRCLVSPVPSPTAQALAGASDPALASMASAVASSTGMVLTCLGLRDGRLDGLHVLELDEGEDARGARRDDVGHGLLDLGLLAHVADLAHDRCPRHPAMPRWRGCWAGTRCPRPRPPRCPT